MFDSSPYIIALPIFPLSLFTLPSLNSFWAKPILSLQLRLNNVKSYDINLFIFPRIPRSIVFPFSSEISGLIENAGFIILISAKVTERQFSDIFPYISTLSLGLKLPPIPKRIKVLLLFLFSSIVLLNITLPAPSRLILL